MFVTPPHHHHATTRHTTPHHTAPYSGSGNLVLGRCIDTTKGGSGVIVCRVAGTDVVIICMYDAPTAAVEAVGMVENVSELLQDDRGDWRRGGSEGSGGGGGGKGGEGGKGGKGGDKGGSLPDISGGDGGSAGGSVGGSVGGSMGGSGGSGGTVGDEAGAGDEGSAKRRRMNGDGGGGEEDAAG